MLFTGRKSQRFLDLQIRLQRSSIWSPQALQKNAEAIARSSQKLDEVRLTTAKDFAKTTKKTLVPNLENLDKVIGSSTKSLKSLRGREGFGGLLEAITMFFINADLLFKDYFSYITDTSESGLNRVYYQFEELMLRLDNVTVFTGNRIRNSFAAIMGDIEDSVLNLDVRVPTILIPSSAFSFEKVEGAGQKLDQLVNQINGYSVGSRTAGFAYNVQRRGTNGVASRSKSDAKRKSETIQNINGGHSRPEILQHPLFCSLCGPRCCNIPRHEFPRCASSSWARR